MDALDRRPSEVMEEFRHRLLAELAPLGFEVRAKGAKLCRKRAEATHRIELSSSHRNQPGDVTCWVTLLHEDKATRAAVRGWQAGGGLGSAAFSDGEPLPTNIADPEEARQLLDLVFDKLAFFDVMDNPTAALSLVSSGYLAGFVDPVVVVPFLRARLGAPAVTAYARALLSARQELWPAFVGHDAELDAEVGIPQFADHGTQLGLALAPAEKLDSLQAPPDVVRSHQRSAKALRSHFGLQLRAWGEAEAACLLRRIDDDAIVRAGEAIDNLADGTVSSVSAARLVLALATGEDRLPGRAAPSPRFFQYYAGHEAFETRSGDSPPGAEH